jgi:microcystin-dependent protein
VLPINTNQPLYAVIGTVYGGDGETTFALPDLRGRAPLGTGPRVSAGQKGGEEAHTLSANEMPTHTHVVGAAATAGTTPQPAGGVLAGAPVYGPPTDGTTLQSASVSFAGGGAAHPNMQPFLALSVCINASGALPAGA